MNVKAISLEAAIAMTGFSKRTLWRRISSGAIRKFSEDARGRAMLSLADVIGLVNVPMDDDDRELLLRADEGDAQAQADIGAMFHVAGAFGASIYWFRQAVGQRNPDAMQWLGRCHAGGQGVAQDANLAIMWLAKSAALGHPIARQQLAALIQAPREDSEPLPPMTMA